MVRMSRKRGHTRRIASATFAIRGPAPGQKVLIQQEERLNGARLAAFAGQHEIAVVEALLEGILHQLVIAAVLPLSSEGTHPGCAALDLSP